MATAKRKSETRDVTPLFVRASVDLKGIDLEARTVPVVWSTGAPVLRRSWSDGPFYEELSLDPKHVRLGRLNNGAPVLDSHNSYDLSGVLGVAVPGSAKIEKGEGRAVLRFAKPENSPDQGRTFNNIADGIVQNVSIGYRVFKFEKSNGQDGKIPTMRAVDWEPFEISPVPIGADDAAGFRADKAEKNTCEFITREGTKEIDMDPEEIAKKAAAEKAAADAAAADASQSRADAQPAAPDADAVRREGALAEGKRRDEIAKLVRTAKLSADFGEKLVKDNTPLDKAREAVLNELARIADATPTNSQRAVEFGQDEAEKRFIGAQNWLLRKSGQDGLVRKFAGEGAKIDLDPGEFRGMTMVELSRHYLEAAGVKVRGWDKMKMVGEALIRGNGITQSTSDFSTLLENTMHKILQAAYGTTPDTWTRFCNRSTVSDFRAHNRYRLGNFSALDAVGENGEFKNKAIADAEKASITASTKGNIINLSRQAIINDDMGAFSRLAALLGRAAKLSVESDVYALLALNSGLGPTMPDGHPLFDAAHNNTGTGAAISVVSIDADRVLMAQQKDPNGNDYLDLRPTKLLVPIGLGGTAKVINRSAYDPDTANKLQRPNMVVGLFDDIIDTPRITGTRRYIFADPGSAPVIEVAFLDGADTPFMEVQNGWRVDGVEWKVRLDYGTAGVDFRGAVTNAGA